MPQKNRTIYPVLGILAVRSCPGLANSRGSFFPLLNENTSILYWEWSVPVYRYCEEIIRFVTTFKALLGFSSAAARLYLYTITTMPWLLVPL